MDIEENVEICRGSGGVLPATGTAGRKTEGLNFICITLSLLLCEPIGLRFYRSLSISRTERRGIFTVVALGAS